MVRPRRGVGAAAAVAAVAIAMVALVYANTSSEWPQTVLMSEGQRTTKLAWGGFTGVMQDEADRALRLCKVGLLGKKKHCATHVVSTEDSKWTHTDAGQPTWAESQRVLDRQVPSLISCHLFFCWSIHEPVLWQLLTASANILLCSMYFMCLHIFVLYILGALCCSAALYFMILAHLHDVVLQSSVVPRGPDIGTPGDFGDRR